MSKRNSDKNEGIKLIVFFIFVYLASRLINLLNLPIFTDEAIYLRWSQIALNDASWRFISLTDGKQPLFIWFTLGLMKFIGDPLFSGRLVSTIAGLFGLLGSFLLGWEVFRNKRVGYFASLFYLISPFFLWYDRLAIMDSLLACFYIWCIYLEVLLARKLRLDIALILGLVLGGAVLTKTSAFFAIYLLPVMLILVDRRHGFKNLFKFAGLSLISVILAYGIYNILRLSPWFYIIYQKDHSFIYTFSEIRSNPFEHFFGNLNGLIKWWFGYFTLPFFLLLILCLIKKSRDFISEKIVLIAFFLLPFTALAMFGKVIYPRFILFMTAPLIILAANGLNIIYDIYKNRILRIVVMILIISYPVYFDSKIIFDPINAPLPLSDRNQYMDDWPSGYGVNEVIEFLKKEKEKQPVFLATEGTFGLFPYAFELEFQSDPKIKINSYWPLPVQQKVINDAEGRPAYLVLKESQELPNGWKGELINQYRRGKGNTYLKFYRITE